MRTRRAIWAMSGLLALGSMACVDAETFLRDSQDKETGLDDETAPPLDTGSSADTGTETVEGTEQDPATANDSGTEEAPSDSVSDTLAPSDTGSGEADTDPGHLPGFLRVVGSRLVDDEGNEVRLTGVNWFGMETSNRAPHGLWSRDFRSMLEQVRDLGFNTLRLPWSNGLLDASAQASGINVYGVDAYNGADPMNAALAGKSPLEVLDAIIAAAAELGLMVFLDNHSRKPDGYMAEALWYTAEVSEEKWIEDWRFIAQRYRHQSAVVGFDLDNEPHDGATWGNSAPSTDWNKAAERCGNAILEVHPDALIIVEGVEDYDGNGYWWGGNLMGADEHPVVLSDPSKLVYSPHEYGPEVFAQTWFSDPSYPDNLEEIWRSRFGFLFEQDKGHVLIGEFGIKDAAAFDGKAGVWLEKLMDYAGDKTSWTFWCLNPNSGDTGGILQDDWVSVHEWKMDALRPHLF